MSGVAKFLVWNFVVIFISNTRDGKLCWLSFECPEVNPLRYQHFFVDDYTKAINYPFKFQISLNPKFLPTPDIGWS